MVGPRPPSTVRPARSDTHKPRIWECSLNKKTTIIILSLFVFGPNKLLLWYNGTDLHGSEKYRRSPSGTPARVLFAPVSISDNFAVLVLYIVPCCVQGGRGTSQPVDYDRRPAVNQPAPAS